MGKFRRTPFRCRGCNNRFFVYIPEHLEAAAESPETDPDVAKPAGP
jgi:hypothetical protein